MFEFEKKFSREGISACKYCDSKHTITEYGKKHCKDIMIVKCHDCGRKYIISEDGSLNEDIE